MKQAKSLAWLSAALIVLATACSKGGSSSGSGNTGSGALLAKEVAVTRNVLNVVMDSTVTLYTYNADKTLAGTEETIYEADGGLTNNTTMETSFSYTGGLISGLAGGSNDTVVYPGGQTGYTSTQTTTTFVASGTRIISYIQEYTANTSITGIPSSTVTTFDSALLAYGVNGQISTYTLYERSGNAAYGLYNTQTYSYSGSNLTGSVIIQNDLSDPGPSTVDTTTTVYQYDGKTSAASFVPVYPGLDINSTSDLSKLTITTVGFSPSSSVASYNTTFNSANHPVTSTIAISFTSPNGLTTLETEALSFFYQ